LFRTFGYGAEVKRFRGNLDFLFSIISNINGNRSIEVAWDCNIEIEYYCDG